MKLVNFFSFLEIVGIHVGEEIDAASWMLESPNRDMNVSDEESWHGSSAPMPQSNCSTSRSRH